HSASPTVTYTLSLHDALPICAWPRIDQCGTGSQPVNVGRVLNPSAARRAAAESKHAATVGRVNESQGMRDSSISPVAASFSRTRDRKSTRLNSSHQIISYAVF